jgi:rhomboid domain-containing protein 1
MVSLAWKGISLERRHGSLGFLLLLIVLTVLTGWIYVGMSALAAQYTMDPRYMTKCAVGFSGVLFALKVLANDSDGHFGLFSVPRKMAIWMELLIIQILVPHASLIGHLSGIVAGIGMYMCQYAQSAHATICFVLTQPLATL